MPSFIISASRRTDIPAFYSEWFMNRIREGYLKFRHPFSRKEIKVSTKPEDVVAIVFWTKHFGPMLKNLDDLDQRGYFYLLHYTITALGKSFEPRVPEPEREIEVFKKISTRIGPERIFLRFDPIVITEKIDGEKTVLRFEKLISELSGFTTRVYFSFMANYARVKRRVRLYERKSMDKVLKPDLKEKFKISQKLSELARSRGMSLYACCQPDLTGFGIERAHCIDANFIARLTGKSFLKKPSPTRASCGCDFSIDIGTYDTCPHLCLYCYANSHPRVVEKNFSSHRSQDEFLVK